MVYRVVRVPFRMQGTTDGSCWRVLLTLLRSTPRKGALRPPKNCTNMPFLLKPKSHSKS